MLYGSFLPISGQTASRESEPYKEKTTLPRVPADVSELVCVTALASEEAISVSRFGNINPIPFRNTPQSPSSSEDHLGLWYGFLRIP